MVNVYKPHMVTVLLSTYNGEKFLQQQLDSLYSQTHPNVTILVRDDGSIDSTLTILRSEQKKNHLIILEGNDNLGPALSFFELMKHASLTETDYIAFCDQDDIWHSEKIAQAIKALTAVVDRRPVMYCSRFELVDQNIKHIRFGDIPKRIGFGNALVENIATGCTILLNRQAIDILCKKLPTEPQMHDWWFYLVVSCFGEVIFDQISTIKYRQHGNNTIGVETNCIMLYIKKFRRFFGRSQQRHWCSEQAESLLSIYGDFIPPQNRQIINRLILASSSTWHRLLLAFSRHIWRQKQIDNLILRILILINRI